MINTESMSSEELNALLEATRAELRRKKQNEIY